jgi:hypothetical protein
LTHVIEDKKELREVSSKHPSGCCGNRYIDDVITIRYNMSTNEPLRPGSGSSSNGGRSRCSSDSNSHSTNQNTEGSVTPAPALAPDEGPPVLLREWNPAPPPPSTPVAPAVIWPDRSPEAEDRRPAYSYPVATFVRDLVRTGMDQIESAWQQQESSSTAQRDGTGTRPHGTHNRVEDDDSDAYRPLSVRSESDALAMRSEAAAAFMESTATVSARTINDLDDEHEDAEFILVDGELVLMPPPPPNAAEQDGLVRHLQNQEFERHFSLRARYHPDHPAVKSCQPNRVRRGVRKLGKIFKRKNGLRRASSKESAQSHVHHVDDSSAHTSHDGSSLPSLSADFLTAPSGADSITTLNHTTNNGGINSNNNPKSPPRKKDKRRGKRRSWRRTDSSGGENDDFDDETSPDIFESRSGEFSSRTGPRPATFTTISALANRSAASIRPPMPPMTPIQETLDASNMFSGGRAASVEARFVGTTADVLEAGVLPTGFAAEAYVEYDSDEALKKDDSLVASVVPFDADYKVDKAEAPDFESMLRRAALETVSDLEASESTAAQPLRPKRVKSDGSSVPLSLATGSDAHVHNDMLKVVMVGAPGVDKSYVARAIRQSHKRGRKRVTLGVDVHSWSPRSDVKFAIWEVQGATSRDHGAPNFGAHAATQALFFSSSCLYLLVWDLACQNVATNRCPSRRHDGEDYFDSSEDEEEYEDDFLREEANRQADRALYADIQTRLLSWVDTIALRGPGSAILPVALIPSHMNEIEVKRRCDTMQNLLENHLHRFDGSEYSPKLLLGQDTILCVDEVTGSGIEQLQETMVAIATDSSRSVFEHMGAPVPTGTGRVLDTVRRLKQDHKLILLDHLLGELGPGLDMATVVQALHFLSSIGEILYFGTSDDEVLSRYIILSRKWLVSALSCILRNDLKRELTETRRFMNMQCIYSDQKFPESEITKVLVSSTASCPLLSDSDARMLWQSMSFMREASDRYAELTESATTAPTMFYFLERLLVHSGVLLPLRASPPPTMALDQPVQSEVFFIPSLLTQTDPRDVWTFKSSESWMTTLCYSWLFRDGAPSDLMEHVSVELLKDLYEFSQDFQGTPKQEYPQRSHTVPIGRGSLHQFLEEHDTQAIGRIKVHQIMCWKTSVLVKIGTVFADQDSGELRESFVEVFVTVVDQSSSQCVASDAMRASMHRVIVSGKGQVGHHGRKLWKGGFEVVLDSVRSSLSTYPNVDSQVVCPECLAHSSPSSACTWGWDSVVAAVERKDAVVRCMRGHRVDSSLISGNAKDAEVKTPAVESSHSQRVSKPVPEMLPSVVLVGLWDAQQKEIRNVGSGFIVDKRLGLVVTAAHVLYDMEEGPRFGVPFFGLPDAKVVIGIIPDEGHNAVFRYFGEIVLSDVHNVDACVVRVTSKMAEDVDDEGTGCVNQTEISLDYDAVESEKLRSLKMTNRFELEESVRILGFNQGGEGVFELGKHVNRSADFAKGYICKKFKAAISDDGSHSSNSSGKTFSPREEIVIMCPTISGHSGGPCVNDEGRVVGILSRADPVDRQRCYLVPATELKRLVTKAKKTCVRPAKLATAITM